MAAVVHRLQPRLRTRRRGLVAVEDLGPAFGSAGLHAELDERPRRCGHTEPGPVLARGQNPRNRLRPVRK
ncbi:hypothetical protein HYE82_06360 [Streptomyces sp. BR123]|uniref:hypothetical protein n=1 Tax=Streptomyces sp. BR123 TaxID=2749828 RepID=UPI0015C41C5E|nr:hypothetical protein [Streptomyces sp. BR123]NXY94021.1 hypothetical protein [Streptomyces sp. BR123]